MNQEERDKFCNICLNCISSNSGNICSLTNSPATFEKECNYFKVNTNQIWRKEKYVLISKYENENKKNRIEDLKTRKIWNIFDRNKHSDCVSISKLNNHIFYKIYLVYSILILIIGCYDFLTLQNKITIPIIYVSLSIVAIFTFSILLIRTPKDEEIQIQIDKDGITFKDNKKYKWNEMQLFEFNDFAGKNFLIIKEWLKDEHLFRIDSLEYFPKRIFNYILKFKNSSNLNSNSFD